MARAPIYLWKSWLLTYSSFRSFDSFWTLRIMTSTRFRKVKYLACHMVTIKFISKLTNTWYLRQLLQDSSFTHSVDWWSCVASRKCLFGNYVFVMTIVLSSRNFFKIENWSHMIVLVVFACSWWAFLGSRLLYTCDAKGDIAVSTYVCSALEFLSHW